MPILPRVRKRKHTYTATTLTLISIPWIEQYLPKRNFQANGNWNIKTGSYYKMCRRFACINNSNKLRRENKRWGERERKIERYLFNIQPNKFSLCEWKWIEHTTHSRNKSLLEHLLEFAPNMFATDEIGDLPNKSIPIYCTTLNWSVW